MMAKRRDADRLDTMCAVFDRVLQAHAAELAEVRSGWDQSEKRVDRYLDAFRVLMSVEGVRRALTPECLEALKGIIDPDDYED